MGGFDIRRGGEVGNSAGDFDDAEVAASTQAESFGGSRQELAALRREREMALHLLGREVTVVYRTTFVSVMLLKHSRFDGVLGR